MNNIAIIQLNRLGDIFQTYGLIFRLRQMQPESNISMIMAHEFVSAVKPFYPDIQLIGLPAQFIVPLQQGELDLSHIQEYVANHPQLKNDFSEIININHDRGSSMLASAMNGIKKYGRVHHPSYSFYFAEEWSAYMVAVTQDRTANIFHMSDIYSAIRLGAVLPPVNYPAHDESPLPPEITELLRPKFSGQKKLILMHIRANNPDRMWPESNFKSLIAKFSKHPDVLIGLTGSAQDFKFIEEFIRDIDAPLLNLAGKTSLIQLRTLIHKADLFVSNDTGPSHIAAMTTTPVITLHLSTAYVMETMPYSSKATGIFAGLDCYPCHPGSICDHKSCLNRIDVESVHRIIEGILFNSHPDESNRNKFCFSLRASISEGGFLKYKPSTLPASEHYLRGTIWGIVWSQIFGIRDNDDFENQAKLFAVDNNLLKKMIRNHVSYFSGIIKLYEQLRNLSYELVVDAQNSEARQNLMALDAQFRQLPDTALKFFHLFVQPQLIDEGTPNAYSSLMRFYSRMEQALAMSVTTLKKLEEII